MTGRDVETDKSSWTAHLLLSSLHLRVLRVPSRAGMVGRYRKQAITILLIYGRLPKLVLKEADYKIILLWTTFFEDPSFGLRNRQNSQYQNSCYKPPLVLSVLSFCQY